MSNEHKNQIYIPGLEPSTGDSHPPGPGIESINPDDLPNLRPDLVLRIRGLAEDARPEAEIARDEVLRSPKHHIPTTRRLGNRALMSADGPPEHIAKELRPTE